MPTTQLHLSEILIERVQELSQATGKEPETLLKEGIDLVAEQHRLDLRRERIERVAGIWKDRDDLPDFEAMRREFDRPWPPEDRPCPGA